MNTVELLYTELPRLNHLKATIQWMHSEGYSVYVVFLMSYYEPDLDDVYNAIVGMTNISDISRYQGIGPKYIEEKEEDPRQAGMDRVN